MLVDARELEVAERQMRVERRAVRRPAGHVRVGRRHLPARLAEALPSRDHGAVLAGVGGLHHAVLGVGLPVEVGGELGEAAEALLALAHDLLRQLALHVLAELAADDAGRLQQARVRLAHFAAGEGKHSQRLASGSHREDE